MAVPKVSFLKPSDTYRRLAIGKSNAYRRMADGTFPQPVRHSGRSIVFIESEVDAYAIARAKGASDEQLRELVSRLIEARQKLELEIV